MKDQAHEARWIAMLAATAVALYLCWLMLQPFIGVLEWATVLVIVFYPIHRRLARIVTSPSLNALISCLLAIVILVLPLTLLAMALAAELTTALPNLQSRLYQTSPAETPLIWKLSNFVHDRLGVELARSQEFIVEQVKRVGEVVFALSLGFVRSMFGGIVKAFFVIFTMFYLFRDGEKIVQGLPGALPLSTKQSEAILLRVREVVSASVYGVVTIAAIQGFLGGLAFWTLGIPSPVLWAVLLTFVCMIPVAGSFLVWLPISIYLMMNGHWTKAILLIAWGALVVSTIDNFLRPKIIRNKTKLHELLVFFSVLGGISLFGLVGLVLGPVIVAITLGLVDTFKQGQVDESPPHAAS